VSIVALVFSAVANYSARRVQQASVEYTGRAMLIQARKVVGELFVQLVKFPEESTATPAEKAQRQAIAVALEQATEDQVNVYEEMCSKYLDKKVDQERFRKMYQREIRTLIERSTKNQMLQRILGTYGSSPYDCIWKCFREWEGKDKP
jgi:hypothetical protein